VDTEGRHCAPKGIVDLGSSLRTRFRANARAFLLLLLTLLFFGCSPSGAPSAKSLEAQIRTDILLGSSPQQVMSYLTSKSIAHHWHKEGSQITAIVRDTAGSGMLVKESVSMVFEFDANLKLSAIKFEKLYTGP
jgi:hypothetical protein